jgi:hypothetical protein
MTAADLNNHGVRLVPKSDRREEILLRMTREWRGSPGLCLGIMDVQARWNLAGDTCAQLLDALVDERVLERRTDGQYCLVRGR